MTRKLSQKVIALLLTLCLVITLIPDIGYATDSYAADTSSSASFESEQLEAVADPAMEGLSADDVVDKTKTTTTFDAGNGLITKVIHGGEVRFENEDGNLVDYDPSLVELKDGEKTELDESLKGYEYRNNVGNKKQYLPETLGENSPIIMEYGENRITITPTDDTVRALGLGAEHASLEDAVVPSVYDGEGQLLPVNAVYGSEDGLAIYTYQSGDAGIKETLTLNEKPESNIFTYEINVGDLAIKENVLDEGITIIDPETDDIIAAIDAPWMNDATGEAYSTDITYDLEKVAYEEGLYHLTMTIDEEYLSDEDRAYPVTIDPTVTWKGNDMIRDTYVIYGSGYAGTNFYESSNVKMPVGTNSTGRHRSLFKIINLKSEIEGMSVASAVLTLYESGTGTGSQTIRANRITEDWTTSTVTWNTQPAYNTAAYTAQGVTTGTKNAAFTLNCTAFARNVSNGTSNYGLIFRNITSDPDYACFWGSRYATTAYRPKLVVTYYDRPTTYTSATLSRDTGSSYETTQYFKEGEKIYATWKGATAYSIAAIQYKFVGFTEDDVVPTSASADNIDLTTYRSIGKAASSATNKNVPYAKYLPEGKYKLFMRTKDAAGYTSWGKYKTVVVDGTAPVISSAAISPASTSANYSSNKTPTITCNITDDYFKETKMSINGGTAFVVNDKDTTDNEKYQVPAGKLTKSGEYTIKIIAYDKSGNKTEKSFIYYLDIDPPVIESMVMTPETDSANPTKDTTPTISWKVTDNNFKKVIFKVNGYEEETSELKEGTLSFVTNTFPDNDVYLIEMIAEDNDGNTTSKTLTYYLDVFCPAIQSVEISPETSILSTSGNKSPIISWYVLDDYDFTMYYSIDQQTWYEMGSDINGNFTLPADTLTDGNGKYSIYVKAVDVSGNETMPQQLNYHYNASGSNALKDLTVTEYYGKRMMTWGIDALDHENFKYDIHRGTTAGFAATDANMIAEDIDAAKMLYIDNEVLSEGTYYYKIVVSARNSTSTETLSSNEASISNTITTDDFVNTLGYKDYLSYSSVEMPLGTASIEEYSGHLMYEQEDFSISNAQLDYSMARTYNSGSDITSMVGRSWMDSYHKELYKSGDDIYFRDSDGSCLFFEYSNGAYTCAETAEYTLLKGDTGYTITDKTNIVYEFNEFGQLLKTSEPNGCQILNNYDGQGRLVTVTSKSDSATTSTSIKLEYADDSYIVDKITDLALTEYCYTVTDGNLEDVTIKGATSGEVFYCYDYNSDDLLSVIYDAADTPNAYSFTYFSGKVNKATYPDGEYLQFSYGSNKTDIYKYCLINGTATEIFDEETVFWDATGKIKSHSDPEGNVTSYTYTDNNPYLVATETSTSEYETVSDDGTVTVVPYTNTVTYTYNEDENLTKESETDGTVTEYKYEDANDANLITYEKSSNSGTLVSEEYYQHDSEGNMISTYDTVTDTQEFNFYNGDGSETDTVEIKEVETMVDLSSDENNGLTTAEIVLSSDLGEEILVTDSVYDGKGNVSDYETESAGITTKVSAKYDAMGREISSTENGVTTTTVYDFLGRAVTVTVSEEGKTDIVTTNIYNGNGSLIQTLTTGQAAKSYEYDCRNRNIKETTSIRGAADRVKHMTYDYATGIVVKDGKGNSTEEFCYTETIKDTAGNVVSESYIDNAGKVVKSVAGGATSYYTYDKAGNQLVSYTEGSGTDPMITLQLFDMDGNNIANVNQPEVSSGSYVISDSSIANFSTFDDKGNVTSEMDAEGTVTKFTYDSEDRLVTYDVVTDTSAESSNSGDTTAESGSEDSEISPSYSAASWEIKADYSGMENGIETTTITDANNNQKVETTNAAGLTSSTTDAGGQDSITRTYDYDSLGRTDIEYFDGGYIDYDYEGDTSRISKRTAILDSGETESVLEYVYDSYGRLSSVTCMEGDSNQICLTEYTYNSEGNVETESVTYAGKSKQTIYYSYDTEGRISSKEYPESTGLGTINFVYDSQGNCTAVKQGTKVIRETVYDAFGRVATTKNYDEPGSSSFVQTDYSYDSFGRPYKMVSTNDGNASGILESHEYSYDKSSQIIEYTHINNLPEDGKKINETRNYTYDQMGNLTQSIKTDNLNGGAESITTYEYDPVGNRTGMTVDGVETRYYYNGLNQLETAITGDTQVSYSYDGRGNQIKEETLIVSGDEDSEVTTVTEIIETAYALTGEMTSLIKIENDVETLEQTNLYNHNGQRISRTQDGTTRSYYYDNGVVAFTEDGSSVSSANVLSEDGAAIGTYRSSTYHSYLKDTQGSTTSIIKEDGTLSAAYDYTDFGETTEITGNSFDNQICYTGGIYDEETELYYLNARYYNPEIGRFISQDSYSGEIDDPGQWHLYAYCANNPINYVDPSGHARYAWQKTVWLKGPKSDYFYRWAYLVGAPRNARKPKLRVGSNSNNRYEIKYFNLSNSQKKECSNYVKYLDNCNYHYNWGRSYLISAVCNLTMWAWLESKDRDDIAESFTDSYNTYLNLAAEQYYLWQDNFKDLKSIFKDIKDYGTKLS